MSDLFQHVDAQRTVQLNQKIKLGPLETVTVVDIRGGKIYAKNSHGKVVVLTPVVTFTWRHTVDPSP